VDGGYGGEAGRGAGCMKYIESWDLGSAWLSRDTVQMVHYT